MRHLPRPGAECDRALPDGLRRLRSADPNRWDADRRLRSRSQSDSRSPAVSPSCRIRLACRPCLCGASGAHRGATCAWSALSCLDELAGEAVENACEKGVFASPEAVAAAVKYVTAQLALIEDGILSVMLLKVRKI